MPRQLVSSGAKWEDIVGYSRAVKVGRGAIVEVAGTTSPGKDAYEQAVSCLQKARSAAPIQPCIQGS